MNKSCTKRFMMAVAAIALFAPINGALAQTVAPPNPGTIARESRERQQALEQESLPRVVGPAVVGPTAPEQLVGPPGGTTFVLKRVVFDHSDFISDAELQAIASRFVEKKIDDSGLQLLVKLVNDLYSERHVITALAYLPKQDLKGGILHVAMIEGRVGSVQFKGNDRLPENWLTGAVPLENGKVVDVRKLEDEIAFFNAGHLAQVQASLQPGAQFGLTDVLLGVIEPPRNSVQAFIDNQGVDSVGKIEGGFSVQHYGLLGIDDRFSASVLGSEGNRNGNIGYNFTANPWGGRLGFSAGVGQIHVVQGPYTSLNIRGTSENEAVNFAQPLFATSNWVSILTGQIAREMAISNQSGVEVTKNTTWKETVGAMLRYTDANVSVGIAPNLSFGQTNFGLLGTRQQFTQISGTFNSSVRLPLEFVGILNGTGQWANQKLLSSEQLFQAGGPTTVRGYSADSVAGYAGYYTNLELHHRVPSLKEDIDAFVFYDHGTVYSTFPKAVNLNSIGGGFSWNISKNFVADASVGVPVTKAFDTQPDATVYLRLTAKWP